MRHQTFHVLLSLVATASVLAGCSGSGSSTTGSSGSTSSGSSGGSGSSGSGSATLTGSDAFTVRAAYYSFGTFADGGPDRSTVTLSFLEPAESCQLFGSGAHLDGHEADVVLHAPAALGAGTFDIQDIHANPLDAGGTAYDTVWPDSSTSYQATAGTVTLSAPDGSAPVTGSLDTSGVAADGGSATLSGTFSALFCQSH